jgi:hypothetical protein
MLGNVSAVGGSEAGRRGNGGCSRLWQQEIGTFTHFRERCESLHAKALAENNVKGAAQLKAASFLRR